MDDACPARGLLGSVDRRTSSAAAAGWAAARNANRATAAPRAFMSRLIVPLLARVCEDRRLARREKAFGIRVEARLAVRTAEVDGVAAVLAAEGRLVAVDRHPADWVLRAAP